MKKVAMMTALDNLGGVFQQIVAIITSAIQAIINLILALFGIGGTD